MIGTSHVIIGGTIGIITKNPAAGFAAGFVSHIICDAIPHLDAPFRLEFRNGNYDTGFVERVMSSDEFEIKPMPARLHE